MSVLQFTNRLCCRSDFLLSYKFAKSFFSTSNEIIDLRYHSNQHSWINDFLNTQKDIDPIRKEWDIIDDYAKKCQLEAEPTLTKIQFEFVRQRYGLLFDNVISIHYNFNCNILIYCKHIKHTNL